MITWHDCPPVEIEPLVDERGLLVSERKFGPEYAKADRERACANRDTIICMSPLCQALNACQLRFQGGAQ